MRQSLQVISKSNEIEIERVYANPSFAAAALIDWLLEIALDRKELSQHESDYWLHILEQYPPDLIQRAGEEWPQRSKFFPRPAEMIELLDELRGVESRDLQAEKTNRYLQELRETRERLAEQGLSHGVQQLQEVMKLALEKTKQIPALPDPNRRMELKERLARAEAERKQKLAQQTAVQPKKKPAAYIPTAAETAVILEKYEKEQA